MIIKIIFFVQTLFCIRKLKWICKIFSANNKSWDPRNRTQKSASNSFALSARRSNEQWYPKNNDDERSRHLLLCIITVWLNRDINYC